jgi:hypothetical protein
VDDEALRRRADVIERVAGDERQHVLRFGFEHREIGRHHDVRVLHLVQHLAVRRLHTDLVADADVAERAELLIAMRRDRAVAFFPGPRRIGQMSCRSVEGIARIALDDGGGNAEPRDLEQSDQVRSHRRVLDRGGRDLERRFDGRARFLLGVGGIRHRETVVPHTGEPDDEERTLEGSQHHERSLIA